VIILISLLPILIEILRERRAKKRGGYASGEQNGRAPGGPEASAAIGVVAAASIAGLAEAVRDEDEDDDGRTPRSHRR
jgi:membrane-associated protein